jgi:hypothetical protein
MERITHLPNLRQALRESGLLIERELKEKVPKASGKLHATIGYEVNQTGSVMELIVSADEVIKYIEGGRRPGKMPPVKAIRDWCVVKGIPTRAAYPIARSIGEKGIKPRPIIEQTIRMHEVSIVNKVQDAAFIDLDRVLDNMFTERLGENWKKR